MLKGQRMAFDQDITFPDLDWQRQTPFQADMDIVKLQSFSALVLGSGMIVRNGYQVYAWGDQTTHHTWGSASKSIVASTMLFFAINEGRLASPDVEVRPYVQSQFPGKDLVAKDYPMSF